MDSEKALQQAVNAIKAGDTETGQQLLAQVISADPQNEAAWLWCQCSGVNVPVVFGYDVPPLQVSV